MTTQSCPHCGAITDAEYPNKYYGCGTHINDPTRRFETCYERQIEQLKNVIKDAIPILEYHWKVVDDGVFTECKELKDARAALGLIKVK